MLCTKKKNAQEEGKSGADAAMEDSTSAANIAMEKAVILSYNA